MVQKAYPNGQNETRVLFLGSPLSRIRLLSPGSFGTDPDTEGKAKLALKMITEFVNCRMV